MFASVGAKRDMYELRASDRVLLDSLLTDVIGVRPDQVRPVSAVLDRWAKYPRASLLAAALDAGLSEAQFDELAQALGAGGDDLLARLPAEAVRRSALASILASQDHELIVFDPLIVRGFDYYTSTVFEVFDADPANSRSLFGGGRYDDLTSLFSAQQIPGIGFGMGDVTLMDFLATHDLLPAPASAAEVVVLPIEAALHPAARSIAATLRAAGHRVTLPVEPRKLGAELKKAGQAGASVAVIVGAEEWNRGELTIRDLRTREQHTEPVAQTGDAVRRLLHQRDQVE